MVQTYLWQGKIESIDVYCDSDWAGCKVSGKSTSGGTIRRGGHLIKTWSRTQKTVALSSGEAELTALVKATCEGMGVSALMKDWGEEPSMVVYADSNAALGVVRRKGAGKLRHVKVGMLWLQDVKEESDVKFGKIDGKRNPADLMTKNMSGPSIDQHLAELGLGEETGRAQKASKLSQGINSFNLVVRFQGDKWNGR